MIEFRACDRQKRPEAFTDAAIEDEDGELLRIDSRCWRITGSPSITKQQLLSCPQYDQNSCDNISASIAMGAI